MVLHESVTPSFFIFIDNINDLNMGLKLQYKNIKKIFITLE